MFMKKLILILTAIVLLSSKSQSDFCNGFKAGYKNGYCYEREIGCTAPITPTCPTPNPGQDGYRAGYNQGFSKGLKDSGR